MTIVSEGSVRNIAGVIFDTHKTWVSGKKRIKLSYAHLADINRSAIQLVVDEKGQGRTVISVTFEGKAKLPMWVECLSQNFEPEAARR
ncbi:hypothetical protein [Rubritalea tangerina]